jgi:hypothetical protein
MARKSVKKSAKRSNSKKVAKKVYVRRNYNESAKLKLTGEPKFHKGSRADKALRNIRNGMTLAAYCAKQDEGRAWVRIFKDRGFVALTGKAA